MNLNTEFELCAFVWCQHTVVVVYMMHLDPCIGDDCSDMQNQLSVGRKAICSCSLDNRCASTRVHCQAYSLKEGLKETKSVVYPSRAA